MGIRTPKNFSEYGRYDLDVGIVCQRCGRTAVFNGIDLMMYATQRGANTNVEVPISFFRFRCRCGSRNMHSIGVARARRPEPLPPRRMKLEPIYVLPKAPE
ncbi:hypothetical protein BH11PSE6_BH11PSE6_01690 [soil metagenome]